MQRSIYLLRKYKQFIFFETPHSILNFISQKYILGALSGFGVIAVGVFDLADKILSLRIFPDTENKFNYSAIDIGAELLVVSQFTLYANTRRGRRPDFISAAKPEIAEVLYSHFISLLETSGLNIVSGEFQTDMRVSLVNTGPVTIMIDSEDLQSSRR